MEFRWPWQSNRKLTQEQLDDIGRAISEAITMSQTREAGYETESSAGTGFTPLYGYDRVDYEAFHNLYHGSPISGIQLGALLSQPVIHFMTAFIIGVLPKVVCSDRLKFQKTGKNGKAGGKEVDQYAQYSGFLNQFLSDAHAAMIDWVASGLRYGDSYLILGTDRLPECIAPYPTKCHPGFQAFSDKLHHFRTEVERVFDEPTTGEKIKGIVRRYWDSETCEYTVESDESLGKAVSNPKVTYDHDLGEVPVAHFANNRESGNVFGISELHPLIPYMNLIHSTIVRGWEAQQYMGKPILKITGIKGSVAQWLFKTFGIRVENAADESDTLKSAMFNFFKRFKFLALSDDADANYVESRYVSGATAEIYRMVFKLFVNVAKIPEFMFGAAIESANAAVREQYTGLEAYIDKKRALIETELVKVLKWALYYYSVFDMDEETEKPLPKYNFITNPEELENISIDLIWPAFLNADEALRNDAVKMLLEQKVMSKQTAIENYKELIPHGDQELERLRSEYADETLPQSGSKGSGQDPQDQRDSQRRNDDKGRPGNNSGRTGSGTGRRAAGIGTEAGAEEEEIREVAQEQEVGATKWK